MVKLYLLLINLIAPCGERLLYRPAQLCSVSPIRTKIFVLIMERVNLLRQCLGCRPVGAQEADAE